MKKKLHVQCTGTQQIIYTFMQYKYTNINNFQQTQKNNNDKKLVTMNK